MNQQKLDFNLSTANQDDLSQWCNALTFFARLVAYVAILALLVLVLLIILKYIADFDDEGTEQEEEITAAAGETNPILRAGKAMQYWTYGSCQNENDPELGNCSTITSSSSEELYDGKICIICYDEQRNCFFVPCGHCATCHDCAERIFNGDNKTCPVCRRLIGKVRRLFSP